MKKRRFSCFFLLLLGLVLASCAAGHDGNRVIAFLRDGHLWTVDPNGENLFEVQAPKNRIVSYGWSPDHHLLAYRELNPNFASQNTPLVENPLTGQLPDLPVIISSSGLDGGSSIPLFLSNTDVTLSQPIWSSNGSRLIFRQSSLQTAVEPLNVHWWVSQNDQPNGIAIQSLPSSYSIPTLSYQETDQRAAGNDPEGLFTTDLKGADKQILENKPLPNHPLSASLERLLWQPHQQSPILLYAVPVSESEVQLILRHPDSKLETLARCACNQFSWSPDGSMVLYSTPTAWNLLRVSDHATTSFTTANDSVPYWSPDSRFLLLDSEQTLSLLTPFQDQQPHVILSKTKETTDQGNKAATTPSNTSLLQPIANSLWSPDGRNFLLPIRDRAFFEGQQVEHTKGLYTIHINDQGQVQGSPTLVLNDNFSQPGWTYLDPNTSFLY